MSIVAVATGGPQWSWANIKRSSTPKWNYVEGRANQGSPKNKRLNSQWRALFCSPLHLGTKESDEALTKINQKHIYTLLAHTPEIPADLQEEEEEEEEDRSEENGSEEEEEEEDSKQDEGRWSDEEDAED